MSIAQQKRIIRSQYFLYFGVMGIFLPYFNLYCFEIGFSGFQIGVLSAARSAVLVLFPLLWGALADRYQQRRRIYILCAFTSAGIWICYLFTIDYFIFLLITLCYTAFYAPLISFLEAFSMDVLGAQKKSYGTLRVWGTVSFIAVVLALGPVIDLYEINIILFLVLTGSVLQALVALKIPQIIPKKAPASRPGPGFSVNRRRLLFLFCAFLMLVSHGAYYGFFSIHLENLGYGKTFMGLAWALASVAEMGVMIKSDAIFKRFSLEKVLLFTFAVAGLRWFVLFLSRGAYVILASQVLHALTYGAFHVASILYVDKLTPSTAKTFGQAANNAVTYGLGLMVGFFMSGWIYERMGAFELFRISAFIAFAGGGLFFLGRFFYSPLRGATK